jgi:hypothetical protein
MLGASGIFLIDSGHARREAKLRTGQAGMTDKIHDDFKEEIIDES